MLILDGAGWHGSAALNIPDNLSLLTLPPYSPELNPVENVWAYLRANKLAITVFNSLSYPGCGSWGIWEPLPGLPFMAGSGGGWIVSSWVFEDRFVV